LEQLNKISISQDRLWEELKHNTFKDKEELETEKTTSKGAEEPVKINSKQYIHQEELINKISDTKAGHSESEETITDT
jgi:hypothetical protein